MELRHGGLSGETLIIPGGTSFAAPTLTGIAASVGEADKDRLRNNPTALKAILMAGARRDVDDLPSPFTHADMGLYYSSPYDKRGGVGSADAKASVDIATAYASTVPNTANQAGYYYDTISDSDFDADGEYDNYFQLTANGNKRRVRAVLTWNARVGGSGSGYDLTALDDLDLQLCRVQGGGCDSVAWSTTHDNNWEFIEYTLPLDSTYRLKVWKDKLTSVGPIDIGIAWYVYENDEDTADYDGDGTSNYKDRSPNFPNVYVTLYEAKVSANSDFELGDHYGWTFNNLSSFNNGIKTPLSLLSFWRLDGGASGGTNIYDDQGNATLTLRGSATDTFYTGCEHYSRPTSSTDITNYGLSTTTCGQFNDGVNQRYAVDNGDDDDYDFGSSSFSVETLISVNEIPSSGAETLVAKHSDQTGQKGWIMELKRYNDDYGRVCLSTYVSDNEYYEACSSTTSIRRNYAGGVQVPELHHVVATFSGSRIYIYVNGEYSGSYANTYSSINNNSVPLSIGTHKDSSGNYDEYFKGSMYYTRIYDTTLNGDQIKQLWAIVDQERAGFHRNNSIGIDTAAYSSIVRGDMVDCRSTDNSNHQGDYWFSTYDNYWASNSQVDPCGTGDYEYDATKIFGDWNRGYLSSNILEIPEYATSVGALIGGTGSNPSDVYIELSGCSQGGPPFYFYTCNSLGSASNIKLKRSSSTSDEMDFFSTYITSFNYDYMKVYIYDGSSSQHISVDNISFICSSTDKWCGCGHDRTCNN